MGNPYQTLAGRLEGKGPLAGRLVPFEDVPFEALPSWDADGIATLSLDVFGNGWVLTVPPAEGEWQNVVVHRALQQQLLPRLDKSNLLRGELGYPEDVGELWITDAGQLAQASQAQFEVAGLPVHFDGPRGWRPAPDEYKGSNESAGWVYGVPFVFKLGGVEHRFLCACDCWTRTAYLMRPSDVISQWDLLWASIKGIWDGIKKGFSIGFSVGNSIFPGIGGIIGAIVGAIAGAFYGGVNGYLEELANDLAEAEKIGKLMASYAKANGLSRQGPNLLGGLEGAGDPGGGAGGGIGFRGPPLGGRGVGRVPSSTSSDGWIVPAIVIAVLVAFASK